MPMGQRPPQMPQRPPPYQSPALGPNFGGQYRTLEAKMTGPPPAGWQQHNNVQGIQVDPRQLDAMGPQPPMQGFQGSGQLVNPRPPNATPPWSPSGPGGPFGQGSGPWQTLDAMAHPYAPRNQAPFAQGVGNWVSALGGGSEGGPSDLSQRYGNYLQGVKGQMQNFGAAFNPMQGEQGFRPMISQAGGAITAQMQPFNQLMQGVTGMGGAMQQGLGPRQRLAQTINAGLPQAKPQFNFNPYGL